MNLPPPNRTPRALTRAAVLSLLVLIAIPLGAQISKYFRTKDFVFYEHYDPIPGLKAQTNSLKNRLTGAEGHYLSNDLVRITRSRLENYPRDTRATNLIALAPESFLNLDSRALTSTGRLEVFAMDSRLFLVGNSGFLYSMTNSSIVVSNRVRAFIHSDMLQPARP